MGESNRIEFCDLSAQQQRISSDIDAAIRRVLAHGQYIMGPEVGLLENALAEYTGARHVISCSSGTDALLLVLMARGIGSGDAVFVPAFTFISTAEVVALTGAVPVFVDVDPDTFLLDPDSLQSALATINNEKNLEPRAIIPVDLFGQPADYPAIHEIAEEHNLFVLADAAQGFGATLNGTRTGTLAEATATSFFPSKPLGCYGDGGAIFTDDADLAGCIESLRVHGKGTDKYDNVRVGMNGRLDTLQAAILIEKLKIFDDELKMREQIAARYRQGLGDKVQLPVINPGASCAWAQFTIRVPDREQIINHLKTAGIPSAIYYPKPLHLQTAYQSCPRASEHLLHAEKLCSEVLSLPMHPYLQPQQQDYIIESLLQVI